MAETHKAMHGLDDLSVDLELVETLLTSRSVADAVFAYTMLCQSLPDRGPIMLANLREIISLLPEASFATGTGMDALESACGYESTPRSYRRLYYDEHGTFGLEFVGGGTLCEGIVVHTESSRFSIHGDEQATLTHDMLKVLITHESLLDSILEALQTLGLALDPPIYVTADDFIEEHRASAAKEALGGLF